MEIATNESALQQMTEICASSYMSIESSHCVATTFLCLAHTPDTHPLLSNPGYLRKLLDAASNNLGSPDALLLLRYVSLCIVLYEVLRNFYVVLYITHTFFQVLRYVVFGSSLSKVATMHSH